MRLARAFADRVDNDPGWERLAPVPFSVVCFRARPQKAGQAEALVDAFNERLLDRVNRTGRVFLSHTKLGGQFTLRLAVGHIRTTDEHVALAWQVLREEADRLEAEA
jgi:aromatic-L-amino-acid decarboxylase